VSLESQWGSRERGTIAARRSQRGLRSEIDRFFRVIFAEGRNLDVVVESISVWFIRGRISREYCAHVTCFLRVTVSVWCALPPYLRSRTTPMEICANHGLMHVGNCSMEDISVSITCYFCFMFIKTEMELFPPLPFVVIINCTISFDMIRYDLSMIAIP